MSDLTRWTVVVTKDTDIAVRSYLAEHGGKKGDLSKFIERAVQKEVLRAMVHDVRAPKSARSFGRIAVGGIRQRRCGSFSTPISC
jgi:hypothetical protein